MRPTECREWLLWSSARVQLSGPAAVPAHRLALPNASSRRCSRPSAVQKPLQGLHLGGNGSVISGLNNELVYNREAAAGADVQEEKDMPQPALLVFSGGTAFNSVAGSLQNFTTRIAHVLPVSDDGGSTAEIVRVLGGPAVGDIRSRCLRLADDSSEEGRAVRELLAHRLSPVSAAGAKAEWYEIVEGDHELWRGVGDPYKHTIRAFLVHFHSQTLRSSTERFNFRNGSIGNFFFAGARTFLRSLEAAIFLFSRVARIPEGSLVLPAVCTEERLTLGARLTDGSVIRGQNQISHPGMAESPGPETVNKRDYVPLALPVSRVLYLAREGTHREHEVRPAPNPAVLSQLEACDAVVYGMGSLFTSICPSLILEGVGERIASRSMPKVLVLNGSHDRETSACPAHGGPMRASDIVQAVTDALNRLRGPDGSSDLLHSPAAYVNAIIAPAGGGLEVDQEPLGRLGVTDIRKVAATPNRHGSGCLYDPDALVQAIQAIMTGGWGAPQPLRASQDQAVQTAVSMAHAAGTADGSLKAAPPLADMSLQEHQSEHLRAASSGSGKRS